MEHIWTDPMNLWRHGGFHGGFHEYFPLPWTTPNAFPHGAIHQDSMIFPWGNFPILEPDFLLEISQKTSWHLYLPGLVNVYIAMENHQVLMGKSTISIGPCSIAILPEGIIVKFDIRNHIPYGSMATVWEGTANPPNYSKLYPSPTSFQKVRLDP